jgi:hypothetical protein
MNRPRVLEMTAKNYLWTPYKDEKNNNDVYYYTMLSRGDRPKVIIYEN